MAAAHELAIKSANTPRQWKPGHRIWRNRHVKVVHHIDFEPATATEDTRTFCGIIVPGLSETRVLDAFPDGYTPCTTCYPDGGD